MPGHVPLDVRPGPALPAVRVSTLELFFDLVFVFTITQLTTVLVEQPSWRGVLRALLVLGVVWWMYGGYAWLTNAVPPQTLRVKLQLMVGMAGFLVMALSIPDAFGQDGVAFGLGYLLVTLVHSGVFLTASTASNVRAILRIAPFNLACALLVIAAGFVEGGADWVLWGLVFVLLWITPVLGRIDGFTINPEHFVERHGLVVIIVLGESIVAVGVGAAGQDVGLRLVSAAVLGLALVAALWWVYFGADDGRAEEALIAAPDHRRTWVSLWSFGYSFVPLLAGVVALAAGVKSAIAHLGEPPSAAAAWYLAGGVLVYVGGVACFRLVLGIRPVAARVVTALLAAATVPIGLTAGAETQMGVLVLLLVALIVGEGVLGAGIRVVTSR